MSDNGFYIKRISVVGDNVEEATINLEKGLNIISGPSDTGKSYIFESINYMLGSSKEPKKIVEAKGYNAVLMEIEPYDGGKYTIRRCFGKEDVEVYDASFELIGKQKADTLKLKHDKERENNISVFYLKKSGYKHPAYVIKNKKGETRTLSFRDMPLYVAISEDKVIKAHSPILSGQYTKSTVEKSIFQYIVSGIDHESTNNHSQNEVSATKLEGQKELLDKLILKEEMKLEGINFEELFSQKQLADTMNEIQLEFEYLNDEIENQTKSRRILWNRLEEDKSKSIADKELIKRFKLLKEYYDTDLKRLSFVLEGNHYFSQLNTALCPYCNQPLNDESSGHSCELNQNLDNLAISIEVEIGKIKRKLYDLESTIEHSEADYSKLHRNIEKNQEEYNEINDKIETILQPKQYEIKKILDSYINEKELYIKHNAINNKIKDLNIERDSISNQLSNHKTKTISKDKGNDENIANSINNFCEYFSKTLKNWKFSKTPRVHFENGEFYINSKSTKDYGKGYRAIIYSGFAISLMKYCRDKRIPHPGFVVLDSPLTTYKSKKSNEEITEDIQAAFFENVASLGGNMQIIILDNKEPSDELKKKTNFEEFTRDENHGRYGFFPNNNLENKK
ncbi:hypothetical protein MKX67_03725 [Cytobacillus sp. FSL W7-1323]|uniref:hypothetical protein n=1 Tax=Cytobacillus sp. FSL W7-1323 TaxID=2921700 RepID=UPI003158EC03